MATLTLNFEVTAPQYQVLQARLAHAGFTISGTLGEIKAYGADVQYNYEDEKLTLILVKAPFLHSMTSFAQLITENVDSVIKTSAPVAA